MTLPASNYMLPFETKYLMDNSSAPATDTLAMVYNDPTSSNNKVYQYNGSAWVAVSSSPPNNDLFGLNVPNLFGVGSTSGLIVGSAVSGTGIAPGTTLAAIPSNSSVTLSQAATAGAASTLSITHNATTITLSGTTTNGSTNVAVTSVSPGAAPTNMALTSAIKAAEVHLVAHGYAKADGSTDDAPMINAAGAALESIGGGKIVFDRPPSGGYYLIQSPILLRDNVTFEGVGPASYIRNASTATNMGACFHGNGITQSNYVDFTKYALNAVAQNDPSITLTSSADAANFAVGNIVLIYTTGVPNGGEGTWSSGSNFQPYFSRQYRITAISGGTLTLDHAIPMALGSAMAPVVSLGVGVNVTFGTIPSKLVDRPVVRNLRLSADHQVYGKTFSGGMYEGLIENILVGGNVLIAGLMTAVSARALWNGNGLARSLIRNIRGTFRDKAIELATGSHDSTVQGVRGSHVGGDGTAGSVLLFAEYTANNTLDDFRLSLPNFHYTAGGSPVVLNVGNASGHRFRNGVAIAGMESGYAGSPLRGIALSGQTYQPTSDIHFDSIDMTLKGQQHNVIISSPDVHNPSGIVMRDLTFAGDAPSGSGFYLGTVADGAIDNCDFNGPLNVNVTQYGAAGFSGPIRGKVTGYSFSGVGTLSDLARLNLRGMARSGGDGIYAARVSLEAVSVSASVASATPVATGTKTGVTGTATSGSPSVTGLSSITGIVVGDVVTATAGSPVIPPGTKVVSIDSGSSSVTLSKNVTTASGSTTMTFTHGEAAFVLPPGQNIGAGDKILVTFLANTTNGGTNRKKNFAIVDDTGTIQSVQVATADTGPVTMRAEVTVESNTALSVTVTTFYPVAGVATPVTTEVRRTGLDLAANGRVFTLQSWFDSSGGNSAITFDSIEMVPALFGER